MMKPFRAVFLMLMMVTVQAEAVNVHSSDVQRAILDERSSARFLEREGRGQFRRDGEEEDRNGEEEDREGTEEHDEETENIVAPPPKAAPHPCDNTTVNHTVTTPEGDKILCMVPTEDMLLKTLKESGGFNQHYVAVTEEQANATFENPFDPLSKSQNFAEPGYKWPTPSAHTGKRRRAISDDDHQRSGDGQYDRMKRSGGTTGLQKCDDKGEPTNQGLKALCTECWWITKLPENKFPRYINERICGRDGTSTGPSTEFCNNFIGMCVQRSMTQDLLVQTNRYKEIVSQDPQYNKAFEQVWELYTQPIRNCCQCQNH